MIIGKIENCERYFSLHESFKAGFDFIKKVLGENLPVGKYEIDGAAVYALIQEYETREKDKKMLEGHKKYIDLQFIAEGAEHIDLIHISNAADSKELNMRERRADGLEIRRGRCLYGHRP